MPRMTSFIKFLSLAFAILPLACFSQKIKKSELKFLFVKTVESIKNNDSISFQKLWEYPDSIANSCGDYPSSIFHEDALLRHFRELKKGWAANIDAMTYYDVDIEKMEKQEIEEFGHDVVFLVSLDKKKSKLYPIGMSVVYHKNKLVYCLGCRFTDQIVN